MIEINKEAYQKLISEDRMKKKIIQKNIIIRYVVSLYFWLFGFEYFGRIIKPLKISPSVVSFFLGQKKKEEPRSSQIRVFLCLVMK